MSKIFSFLNIKTVAGSPLTSILPLQEAGDKYGVMTDDAKYLVSSLFNLDGLDELQRAAIAICDAKIFAQFQDSSNEDLLNVVLKPLQSISANGLSVEYIIYRGVLTNSLIDNDDIQLESYYEGLNFDKQKTLVHRIREGVDVISFDLKVLGLNNTILISASDEITEIFGTPYIDDNGKTISYPDIKGGDIIGIFNEAAKVSIEIILRDEGPDLTVSDIRKAVNIIDVFGLSADEKKSKQEMIHRYIDPAAFYSTFLLDNSENTISVSDVYANYSVPHPPDTLVNFVNQFATGNRVYVDIRNEHGLSLNYFNDNTSVLDKNFHIDIGSGFTSKNYYENNGWPIYYFDITSGSSSFSHEIIKLRFLKNFNPVPVVFADGYVFIDNKVINDYRKFQVDETLLNNLPTTPSLTDQWSEPFSYFIPVQNNKSISCFIKIFVNRRIVPDYIPATALKREFYLDNIIGPLKEYNRYKLFKTGITSQWCIHPYKKYFNYNGIDTMVELGTWLEDSNIAFYINPTDVNLQNGFVDYSEPMQGLSNSDVLMLDFTKQERAAPIRVEVNDSGSAFLLVQSPNYDFANAPILILLSRAEYDSYTSDLASNANTSPYHPNFFIFKDKQQIDGGNNLYFFKFSLDISLFNTVSNAWQYGTSITPSILRTTDSFIFSSNNAATSKSSTLTSQEVTLPLISTSDLIEYIKEVEGVYFAQDYNFIDTCTRIRVHSYGSQCSLVGHNPIEYIKFSLFERFTIRDANYMEYDSNGERKIDTSRDTLISMIFEDKSKYEKLRIAYKRLLSNASENGINDNPSPYIVNINPHNSSVERIDFGHTLLGLEGIYYATRAVEANSDTLDTINPTCYNSGIITAYFKENASSKGDTGIGSGFRKYNIYQLYDLCGLMGDLGTCIGEFFYHKVLGKSIPTNPFYPQNEINATNYEDYLNRYFEINAPEADILSDVDAIGLWYAYNVLKLNNASDQGTVTLSDIFTLYYTGTVRPELQVSVGLNNFPYFTIENRWFIFCHYLKFIIPISSTQWKWLPQLSSQIPTPDWEQVRNSWRLRFFYFAQFWSGKQEAVVSTGAALTTNIQIFNNAHLFNDWGNDFWRAENTSLGTAAELNPILDSVQGQYRIDLRNLISEVFENKFLQNYVKPKVQNEISHTLVNVINL